MSSDLTVPQILEALDAQIARHREREAFHAGQEAMHREERARHAAELERLTRHAESFRENLGAISGLAVKPPRDVEPGERLNLTRLARLAIEDLEPDRPFKGSELAEILDRRFGERLGRRTDRAQLGIVLRRLSESGVLRLVRRGRPKHEAVYARV